MPVKARSVHLKQLMNSSRILRIPRFSSQQTIRKAYRKRAMMYHPDLNPDIGPEYGKMIEEEMRKINLAKEILLSPDKKYMYDSVLRQMD